MRRLTILLIIFGLVSDPTAAVAQAQQPSRTDTLGWTPCAQAFSLMLTSRFGPGTPTAGRHAAFHELEAYADDMDFQLHPDGTAALVSPFTFMAKHKKPKGGSAGIPSPGVNPSSPAPKGQPNTIVKAGLIVLLACIVAIGGWFYSHWHTSVRSALLSPPPIASSPAPPGEAPIQPSQLSVPGIPYQTELQRQNLNLLAEITQSIGNSKARSTKVIVESMTKVWEQILDSGDRVWVEKTTNFHTALLELYKARIINGGRMDGAWTTSYLKLIQGINDQLLLDRGWYFLPGYNASEGYILVKVERHSALRASYTDPSGLRIQKSFAFIEGEVLVDSAIQGGTTSGNLNGMAFGLPGRETVFRNTHGGAQELAAFQKLLDPNSPLSQAFSTPDLEAFRANAIQSLERSGWLQNGKIKTGFAQARQAKVLHHETGHALRPGPEGLVWSAEEEPYQWLNDLGGPMGYLDLAQMVVGAKFEEDELHSRGITSDAINPFAVPRSFMTRGLWELAKALGDQRVAARIAQYRTEGSVELQTLLMALSKPEFMAVRQKALDSLKPNLPGPSEWTLEVIPASLPSRAFLNEDERSHNALMYHLLASQS